MNEKTALITGAGSGLGRALAHWYARAGYQVACADIVAERAENTVLEIGGAAAGHFACSVDVGDDASVEALRDALTQRWQRLDVLINNAGVATAGSIADSTLDDWRWVLNINVLGVVRGCRAFVPWLQRQGHGQVINIASFAALAGVPNAGSYAAAKAAVVALSEALRGEMHTHGVRVAVACPSFFQTNLLETGRGPRGGMLDVAARMMAAAKVSADDIAAYVASAAARGEFLLIPTAPERMRWRLKRFLPEYYFRKLMKLVAARAAQSRPSQEPRP